MDLIDAPAGPDGRNTVPSPNNAEKWLVKQPCAAFIFTFFLVLFCGLPGLISFIFIPITVLGTPILAGILFVRVIYLTIRKRCRGASSAFAAAALPIIFFPQIAWAANVIHVGLTVCLGIGEIGHTLPQAGSKFQAYDWSVGLVTNPSTFLLYDETDQIALPAARHRDHLILEGGVERACAGEVDHLIGHYYVCVF